MCYIQYRNIIIMLCLYILNSSELFAQDNIFYGYIKSQIDSTPINNTEIYDANGLLLTKSNTLGYFNFRSNKKGPNIIIFSTEYNIKKKTIKIIDTNNIIYLKPLSIKLDEIEINERRKDIFGIKIMDDIVETSIYAGKKSEEILIENSTASLALNNSRQIYSQVSGLNIYQNDDAGLQLNIGGRGLDPNRTSNFNTRQNGYDISADVLGYPESYYTPSAEALERIEIIRGAASLQYGTQFGGLINFVIKQPPKIKKQEYIYRISNGSNGLFSNFISVAGKNKINYYSFINYKQGDGFRKNSSFSSTNGYIHLNKKIGDKITSSFEITYLKYLAQQAGGLNDQMFIDNPIQSNRTRNWFSVNWLLLNCKLKYKKSEKLLQTINVFGLSAERYALGYRSNRVEQADPMQERDLILGKFRNYGLEYRILYKRKIFNTETANLIGVKFYKSNNTSMQGPGSKSSGPDFNFYETSFPYYQNQSSYNYPNKNIAVFGENIIYINQTLTITPGFRFENIDTKSIGEYKNFLLDNANNVISEKIISNNQRRERNFFLLGLGVSKKLKNGIEFYTNISQNYRSVTFSDISIVNPAFIINPDIDDESGYTTDIGVRGNLENIISFDINTFYLRYNKRIGFIQKKLEDGNVKSERGNVGDARIIGIESIINLNLDKFMPKHIKLKYFINNAYIESEYINSKENGIQGNVVEFIPKLNIKTGIKLAYKNLNLNIQYTYLDKQFTDATNALESNLSGVVGEIPNYDILDIGATFKKNNFTIETGINNLLNRNYFTRRATGYPGPGIIPSPTRNYFITIGIKF